MPAFNPSTTLSCLLLFVFTRGADDVTLGGDLEFYTDAAFTEAVTAQSIYGQDTPFVIGQDTIYGKVTVLADPEVEGHGVVDVSIEAVYVCTEDPDADDDYLAKDSDTRIGVGCLSSSIDADGPYQVIGTGATSDYQGNTTLDVATNNEVAFSFLTFDTPRSTIYVHAQVTVTFGDIEDEDSLWTETLDVVAEVEVQLFIPSLIGYGRSDGLGNYTVTVLTQSAEFLELGMDNDVSVISWPDGVTILDIETVTPSCLVASPFTCGQIFVITVAAECSDDDNTADLSGNYQLAFTPQCRIEDDGTTDPACDIFMDSLDGDDVVLEFDSEFVDDCSPSPFDTTFESDLEFYADTTFTVGILEMLAVLVVAAFMLLVVMWSVRSVVGRFGVRAGRDEKVMVSVNSRVSAPSLSEV